MSIFMIVMLDQNTHYSQYGSSNIPISFFINNMNFCSLKQQRVSYCILRFAEVICIEELAAVTRYVPESLHSAPNA